MSEQKQPAEVGPVELVLGLLPEPDLQTDPCSAAGKQTDYYTAGTVLRLLAAERERCAQRLEAIAASSPDGDTDRDALLAAADELRRA